MNISNQITEILTIQDILHKYGVAPGIHNRTACPIHGGKDRNFCYTDKVFHCWPCGAKGNVVSLVAQMFGLDNNQAAIKINNDFNLNLISQKPTYRDRLKAQEIERQRIEANEKTEYGLELLNQLVSIRREIFQMSSDDNNQVKYLDRMIERFESVPSALVDWSVDIDNLRINLKGCVLNGATI